MLVWDWSATANDNTSINGVNIDEGCLPSGINNAIRNVMADVAGYAADTGGALTTTGSANAYVLATTAGGLPAYADGIELAFVANFANSGAATLDVDGVGAKAVRKVTTSGDVALSANDIVSAGHFTVRYDASANSAAGAWILVNPTPVTGTAQPLDATLTSLAGLSVVAGSVPVGSGADAFTVQASSAAGRSLWNFTDPNADRVIFWDDSASSMAGLSLGTGLSISGTTMSLDGELVALAGLTSAADTLPYFTGSGSAGTTTMTAAARGLLDDANAAAMQSTLGLVPGTDVEAHDADLTTIAGLAPSNDDVLQRKSGAWANRTPTQLLTDLGALGKFPFPATQVPSAGANDLDDYEEGTFTPTITFGGNAVGMTFSLQLGSYVKIGIYVFFNIQFQFTAKGSSAGNSTILGLPFTVLTLSYPNSVSINTMASGVGDSMITSFMRAGTLGGDVYKYSGGNRVLLTNSDFTDTSLLILNGFYGA